MMVSPPLPSTAQAPQYTQQFLSNVLSQHGPSGLPYTEDVKWLIRQHLVSLIEAYPSLQVKNTVFTHNDGRTVNLLQSEGTIPMFYQQVLYNIPVVIWLMEAYPHHRPCVYVVPTRDMIIKRGHPHVNPSGLVSAPYLHSWVFPSSNLVDLVRTLSHIFGRDPPLYTKQPRSGPRSNANTSSTDTPSSVTHSSIPPRTYSPYNSSSCLTPSSHQLPTDDPSDVFKRNTINKLVERLHKDADAIQKSCEAEIESLFTTQASMRQREEQISKGLREMQNEREALEQQLQIFLMNSDVLEAWVRENEKGLRKGSTIEIDEAFEPCDILSKQMLECSAADLAIEDVIYSLDKAVQEGSIPFDLYVKYIRLLSREQFFHRATAAKVRAVQMHAQVTIMAARAQKYGM